MMNIHSLLLTTHISLVTLSAVHFTVRGVWMMSGSSLLARRWVRIAPHLVDACLLCSGIGLVVLTRQYPTDQAWLSAKLVALLVYIVLGSLALKRARTRHRRVAAWLAALAVYAYMISVALSRQPLPIF